MKTKCLLLFLAFHLSQLHIIFGQSASTANPTGYVSMTLPTGQWALIANPFNKPANTLASTLPDVPVGTQIFKFSPNTQRFESFIKLANNSWSGNGAETVTLDPGEGFFLKNNHTEAISLIFNAELLLGTLTVQIPAGYSLLASKVPQEGRLESDLKFPAQPGTRVYLYRNGSYLSYTRRAKSWTGGKGEPILKIGEGFFVYSPVPATWTRQFSL